MMMDVETFVAAEGQSYCHSYVKRRPVCESEVPSMKVFKLLTRRVVQQCVTNLLY